MQNAWERREQNTESENLKGGNFFRNLGYEYTDWIHLAQMGPVVGSCAHGHEPFVSMKGRQLLNQLHDCLILMKDSGSWSYLKTYGNL